MEGKVHHLSKEVNVRMPSLNTQSSNINHPLFFFQEHNSSQVVDKSWQSGSSDFVSCIHLCGFLSLKIQQAFKKQQLNCNIVQLIVAYIYTKLYLTSAGRHKHHLFERFFFFFHSPTYLKSNIVLICLTLEWKKSVLNLVWTIKTVLLSSCI